VEQDEREITERRAILNYGHTFAHAFETVGGYGSWLHGEAVAAGMVCASRLAELLRRIPSEVTEKQFAVLRTFHLPVAPKPEWPDDELIEVMKRDKKARSGSLRFVLPTRIGHVELVDDVPEALVRQVLSA
jgi:3-dehydroquinate synthase